MSLRVVIADDEPSGLSLLRQLVEKHPDLELAGEAVTGDQTVDSVRRLRPELLLLDIEMPEQDGFAVLQRLQQEGILSPQVIFVTAYDKYAVRAFEAQALDYLLKPVDEERFLQAIDRCRDPETNRRPDIPRLVEDALRKPPERILIRQGGRIVPVLVEAIDWVEDNGDYVNIHVKGRTFLIEKTLTKLESLLAPRSFMRIHRSTLVNQRRIRELKSLGGGRYKAVLSSGEELVVSRKYARRFQQDVL